MKHLMKFLFVGTWSVLLFACQEDVEQADTDADDTYASESAEGEALLEGEVDELLQFSVEAATVAENGRLQSSFCATRTVDEASNTVTLDFGDGCTGPVYGRLRTGKVIIRYEGERSGADVNRTITFENYSVNERGITGMIETERATDGQTSVAMRKLTDLTVTYKDGKTTVLNGTEQRQWTEGRGDGNPSNDIFEITGTLEGVDRAGRSFTSVIVEPITVNTGCDKYVRVSGTKEVTTGRNQKYTTDFGDGSCDNVITVTTPRRTFDITVR